MRGLWQSCGGIAEGTFLHTFQALEVWWHLQCLEGMKEGSDALVCPLAAVVENMSNMACRYKGPFKC